MDKQRIWIPSVDGFPLSATLFPPSKSTSSNEPFVIINCATGCPAFFYYKFASFLCSKAGCTVLCWDYRGVGGSFVKPDTWKAIQKEYQRDPTQSIETIWKNARFDDTSPDNHNIDDKEKIQLLKDLSGISTLQHWGMYDNTSIMAYVVHQFISGSSRELVIIGHSVGGHLIPLAVDYRRYISRVCLIGCNSAYWLFNREPSKSLLLWCILLPVLSRWYGFMPNKMINFCEDLPIGIMEKWRSWSKHPDYLVHGDDNLKALFKSFQTVPLISLSFEDDELSKKEGFDAYLRVIGHGSEVQYHLAPKDVDAQKVGHNGFFSLSSSSSSSSSSLKDPPFLWTALSQWILTGSTRALDERKLRKNVDPQNSTKARAKL